MKTFTKIFLGIVTLLVLAGVGLSIFVRFYLTEERLKSLLIPPTEQALERKVSIGSINVSIFRGITLKNFSVKETDGEKDFIRAQAFVLSYDLLPLLSKKLIISEVRLLEPELRIVRDKHGKFNFESFPFLAKTKSSPPQKNSSTAGALPLALTINQIRIEKAKLSVVDAKQEIPAAEITADLAVALSIAPDLSSFKYDGDLTFLADIVHGKLTPKIKGKSHFDTKNLTLSADVNLDREQLHLESLIENYTASPKIQLDMSSEALDIDHLMALIAGLPAAAEKTTAKPPSTQEPLGKSFPPDLDVKGKIQVAKAVYNDLTVSDFLLNYTLQKGVFTITSLTSKAADGEIKGEQIVVDLNQSNLRYRGKFDISGLQLAKIRQALSPQTPDIFGGKMETSLNFNGSGTGWPEIQKTLTVDSSYSLKESWLKNTELTRTVSSLVGLQELNDLSFENVTGSLRLENGKVLLKSNFTGKQIGLQTQGSIGLDGSLNMPLTIKLSSLLSEKLRQRVAVAKYLADEAGETVLKLSVTGTVKQPRPTLDPVAVQEQTEKVIKNKLYEEIDKALPKRDMDSQKPDPARELLKGLFGK